MSALLDGLFNPLAVPAHALALLALGLLIGQHAATRSIVVGTAAFAAGLSAGLAAIVLAIVQTAASNVLLVVTALAAALVALARPLPITICAALTATGGIALGLDSPPQAISIALAITTLAGTGLGAFLAIALIAACAYCLQRPWQLIAVRIVGSWIAASAILVLALRYTRGQLL